MKTIRRKNILCLTVLLFITILGASNLQAADSSLDVAIVASPTVINGGSFPTSGGGFDSFNFTNVPVADVNAATLSSYDTVLLNVAGYDMLCTTSALTTSQKTDLIDFVSQGGKLIIYDSECPAADYSWLPYPFTTNNPGAMGAHGTLNIVEDNYLSSSDPVDVHFIDAAALSTSTDAVGDMNVKLTYDPNWCLDMSGTNINNVTGPVHTYARYGSGLIIYNGLDVDYMSSGLDPADGLSEIWLQELLVAFDPVPADQLPCGITVVGISLTPVTAENEAGTDHTVTAKVTALDAFSTPQVGVEVTFEVKSGPNAGASGTCSSNTDCTTDPNGEVSFTYTGSGGEGTDEIVACFTNDFNEVICSPIAEKTWVITNQPPDVSGAYASMGVISLPPNHKWVEITILGVTDPDGDPVTITITGITQDEPTMNMGSGDTCPDGMGIGTEVASVRSERQGGGNGRIYRISFDASDGQAVSSGSVTVCVPHSVGNLTGCEDDGQDYDSTVCN